MSGILFSPSPSLPHQLGNPRMHTPPMSSSQQQQPGGNGRKRKADDDDLREDSRMSLSPSASPAISTQTLPQQHQPTSSHRYIKRTRTNVIGRPLTLPRLLETLDVQQLRNVLKNICEQNPQIGSDVVKSAPRPTVSSALSVLKRYENEMLESFPYSEASHRTSDYAFNRVRHQLTSLLEALADFTPHFLPPNETQSIFSLQFLDGATDLIHRLPDWSSFQNTILKTNAYDEIGKAWILVIKEASKRAGGIQLKYDGWDKKLLKHNEQSGDKLQSVIDEMRTTLGWAAGQASTPEQTATGAKSEEVAQIRQELFSNTYGNNYQVRVGPW